MAAREIVIRALFSAERAYYGTIWRNCSVRSFGECDVSPYIETEAMALSRDIPAALRLTLEPIVRRVAWCIAGDRSLADGGSQLYLRSCPGRGTAEAAVP